MQEFAGAMESLLGLGLESRDIGVLQMCLRAVIVYVVTVLIVRLGKKRFMGRTTAFDVILGIMLGSIVSRAITGNSPFFPALAASAALIVMHWLFSGIALYWHGFGWAIKGKPELLVQDGKVDERLMRQVHMTEHDLSEDLRGNGVSDLAQVGEARLERNGELSVIKAKSEAKVVEVKVAAGIQTLRIEIAS